MKDPKRWQCTMDSFAVEGDDDEEIIKIVKIHHKDKHNIDISDDDIRAKMTEF